MKNIHVLPTSQPSNLLLYIKSYIEHKDTPAENSDNKGNFRLGFGIYANKVFYQPHHIYITSDEEIKKGDWRYNSISNTVYQKKLDKISFAYEYKITLTTDQGLIKDGVQGIDDDFLEWFVKNPSCKYVELEVDLSKHNGQFQTKYGYKIIIPKEEQKQHLIDMMRNDEELGLYEEPKQETLEEDAERYIQENIAPYSENKYMYKKCFIDGAKWQQEQSYSEEDVIDLLNNCRGENPIDVSKWFEQFKKK